MSVRIIEEFDHFYQDKSLAIYCTVSILKNCYNHTIANYQFIFFIYNYNLFTLKITSNMV
jgi:hypothetical protein